MRIRRYKPTPTSKLSLKGRLRIAFAYLYAIIPIGYLLVLLHKLFFKKCNTYKYEISLCLIFKDEERFLKEWIEYHLLIGVEHFYLYNNFSSDNFMTVLKPYIEKDIVTLVEWPYKYAQKEAYKNCYLKYKSESHWIGFIDTDEFVNLQKHDDIRHFLSKFNDFPSVTLHWRMFGTSGILKESYDKLVIEQYVASWPWLCHTGKSFINCDYKFKVIDVHFSTASMLGVSLYGIDDMGIFIPFMYPVIRKRKPCAYLNHYWSKSREFYLYKDMSKGDVADKRNENLKRIAGRFEYHELNNMTRDYSIQRWLILLKERM